MGCKNQNEGEKGEGHKCTLRTLKDYTKNQLQIYILSFLLAFGLSVLTISLNAFPSSAEVFTKRSRK